MAIQIDRFTEMAIKTDRPTEMAIKTDVNVGGLRDTPDVGVCEETSNSSNGLDEHQLGAPPFKNKG